MPRTGLLHKVQEWRHSSRASSTAEVCDAVFRERCRISDVETLTSVEKPTSASTREMVALWCRSEPRRSNRASGAVTTTNCACGWAGSGRSV